MTLSPTISLEQARVKRWDCIVIGSGPAGAIAARQLALGKASVLLVDKSPFPRYKVCGCCLNPRSLAILSKVGLSSLTRDLGGILLDSVKIAARKRFVKLPIPVGISLSRAAFDSALVQSAIEAGAAFLPTTTATLEARFSDHHRLVFRCNNEIVPVESRFVIAATGLGGKLVHSQENDAQIASKSRIGAGVVVDTSEDYPAGMIHMACGKEGYVGLVRIEDNRLDIAAAFDAHSVKVAGGLGALAVQILEEAGFPAIENLANLVWKGTSFLTRKTKTVSEHRLYYIGDAAGYIEPFTGEGMAWALASGVGIAPLILEDLNGGKESAAKKWPAVYRQQIADRQVTCRAVATVLRYPTLTRTLIRVLAAIPGLAKPVLRRMYRP